MKRSEVTRLRWDEEDGDEIDKDEDGEEEEEVATDDRSVL